jgi:predicted XRE-type DNA-binding protein
MKKPSKEKEKKRGPRSSRARTGEALSANIVARADLMAMVSETIQQRGWTQADAAAFLGVGQPRISDLVQGHIHRFTVDMLMIWMQKLGKDVSVSVHNSIFGHEGHAVKVQLALYVCGNPDVQLLDNIAALFGGDSTRYDLRIVNVLDQPSVAAAERITATPSLVKEAPKPRLVITGDLSAKSVRWQLAIAERSTLDNRHTAQDLRQANQDQREADLYTREGRVRSRKEQHPNK